MAIVQVNIDNINTFSLQVGDTAYVSTFLSGGGGIIESPDIVGKITEINSAGLRVQDDQNKITDPTAGYAQQYLSFSKDIRVNESSLKGYYADVTFKNESSNYAELFAVSSEISLSSK